MNCRDVTSQAEYEAAEADPDVTCIHVTGSSRVVAWGSSSVVAWDSSSVEARGSSRVEAWDSSRVLARGSTLVEAWGSSSVEAGSHVPIQVHPGHRGDVAGGVRIDLPDPEQMTAEEWAAYHGVAVEDGHVVLFKALDDGWHPGWTTDIAYVPGTTVEAPDFTSERRCGGGLHFGVTPGHASMYRGGASRWVACRVSLDGLVPLDDKAKARSCEVLFEVDRGGRPVGEEVSS